MKLERIGDDVILFCGNLREVRDEVAIAAQAAREAGAEYLTIWPTDAVAIAKGQRPLTMASDLPKKLRDAHEAL